MSARSAPDGYTVLAGATTVIAANPALFKSLSYNPRTDFDAVIGLGTIPVVGSCIRAFRRRTWPSSSSTQAESRQAVLRSGTAGNIIPSRILSTGSAWA